MLHPVTVAVDAMGSDSAPEAEVEGALLAAEEFGAQILLVGREEVLHKELAKHFPARGQISIIHAEDVVTMEDNPARAARSKRRSSIHTGAQLVRQGKAAGLVSAGNTGAVMATALRVMGRIPGVYRPAVAQIFPTSQGGRTLVLDVGANVDCTPDMLVQFAVMGDVYSRVLFGCVKPRIGVLSIGEEDGKGNELTKEATPLLKRQPFHFIGNVEGRDFYSGKADVIVCDGFVGNVALKVSEGLVKTFKTILIQALEATVMRQIGYGLARGAFDEFQKRVDYEEYGGAPMLGVRGGVIICHGRSTKQAIKNAIRMAVELDAGGLNRQIEQNLEVGLGRAASGLGAGDDSGTAETDAHLGQSGIDPPAQIH